MTNELPAGPSKNDHRFSWIKYVAVPLLVAAIGAIGVIWAGRGNDEKAPERAMHNANTMITITNEIIQEARVAGVSPDIIEKIQEVEGLARRVETDAKILRRESTLFSTDVDFWLRPGQAGQLHGNGPTFGLVGDWTATTVDTRLNGTAYRLGVGEQTKSYSTSGDTSCVVTYMGKIDSTKLYGFKVRCFRN